MKGIVFEFKLRKLIFAKIAGFFRLKGYLSRFGPFRLKDLPDPQIRGDNWVVVRTEYCGICGSDTKQVFLHGNRDNPLIGLISFPQVLGHEVVGTIVRTGPSVNIKIGTRIILYPNISCKPRNLPPCKACQEGDYTLCRNFTQGNLSPGIHTGNSSDATGGFAELLPAHEWMVFPIPDGITWKQAIIADPFSVAFHSILKVLPSPGSICAVYGCGTLGLLTVQILKHIFEGITVIAIARFPHQADMAKLFGADIILKHRPTRKIVEQIASYVNCDVYYINGKKPWLIEGVDFLFDTVASNETLEIGLRIVKAREKLSNNANLDLISTPGAIVMTGVSTPKRFEWTPWYFKEIRIIGSNAFGDETFEGRREHAYRHYFRFLNEGLFDPSPIITHTFPLKKFKDALVTTAKQKKNKAIKVVLTHKTNRQVDKK